MRNGFSKYIAIAIMLGGLLVPIHKIEASGFPTVDIAAVAQRLEQMISQAKLIEEQINQGKTLDVQADAVLGQYEEYLESLLNARDMFSSAEWDLINHVLNGGTIGNYGRYGNTSIIPTLY